MLGRTMEVSANIEGYLVKVHYSEMWTASICPPGADKPHPVLVRASTQEGKDVLLERVKVLITALKEKAPPKRGHAASSSRSENARK
jgi:hypothetical protein